MNQTGRESKGWTRRRVMQSSTASLSTWADGRFLVDTEPDEDPKGGVILMHGVFSRIGIRCWVPLPLKKPDGESVHSNAGPRKQASHDYVPIPEIPLEDQRSIVAMRPKVDNILLARCRCIWRCIG